MSKDKLAWRRDKRKAAEGTSLHLASRGVWQHQITGEVLAGKRVFALRTRFLFGPWRGTEFFTSLADAQTSAETRA